MNIITGCSLFAILFLIVLYTFNTFIITTSGLLVIEKKKNTIHFASRLNYVSCLALYNQCIHFIASF